MFHPIVCPRCPCSRAPGSVVSHSAINQRIGVPVGHSTRGVSGGSEGQFQANARALAWNHHTASALRPAGELIPHDPQRPTLWGTEG